MVKRIKNMQFIALATILTIVTGATCLAQPGKGLQGAPSVPNEKEIDKMILELDKKLDLNDERQVQVSKLYFDHFEKVEALMKQSQRPDKEKMEKLDTALEKNVKAILDKKQKKKYTSWLKEQKKQRGNPPQGGRPGGPPR